MALVFSTDSTSFKCTQKEKVLSKAERTKKNFQELMINGGRDVQKHLMEKIAKSSAVKFLLLNLRDRYV